MTIVDEIRKKIKADGGEVKGVNTIVDGLKKMWKEEGSTPAESTPAESTPAESTPAESTPAEGSTPAEQG